ncbi:hypothetical protein [Roseibium sp. TrichSKD4]|uniref:hypothetical protein n=1 Tax=Roseibium sp. TrichSKD4 TaxID=744980 RepID=UPI001112423A|nr:hypothetical protein [Roseibium sp. TrichSKD4]
MKSISIKPRPDQILELSRGASLPLPEINNLHLEVIVETLLQAFENIQVNNQKVIEEGTESEVTSLLVSHLNTLADSEPLWGQLVIPNVR